MFGSRTAYVKMSKMEVYGKNMMKKIPNLNFNFSFQTLRASLFHVFMNEINSSQLNELLIPHFCFQRN